MLGDLQPGTYNVQAVLNVYETFRRADGTRIVLSYNPLSQPRWTTPQQPDAVIEISSSEVRLILDAKYRLQFDDRYIQSYGGPGPNEENINQMHRYRDAVLFTKDETRQRANDAVALFPLPPSVPYAPEHPLYRSISLVGIGGLPCYPDRLADLESYLTSRLGL